MQKLRVYCYNAQMRATYINKIQIYLNKKIKFLFKRKSK